MPIERVNEWIGDYKLRNRVSKKKLELLDKTIEKIQKNLSVVDELNQLYGKLAEKIRADQELKDKEVQLPDYLKDLILGELKKKVDSVTFHEFVDPSNTSKEKMLLVDNGFADGVIRDFLNQEEIKKVIKTKYGNIVDEIEKRRQEIGIPQGDSLPKKRFFYNYELSPVDFFGTNVEKEVTKYEKEAYIHLLEFLASEGKLSGVAYYPGGGGDYAFARKGVKLVIHDPSYLPEESKKKKVVNIKNEDVKGKAKQIPTLVDVDPNNVLSRYNTLIIKCTFYANDKKTPLLYRAVVNNLNKKGHVIEWMNVGFHQDPTTLGLVPDPINPMLERINKSHIFQFYDTSHRSIGFKVWKFPKK